MIEERRGAARKLRLRFGWLALLALAAQLVVIYAGFDGAEDVRRFVFPLSYVLLFAFVVLNWRRIGLWVICVGMALNFLAIVANGGLMPVSPASLERAGLEDQVAGLEPGDPVPRSKNVLLLEDDTHLQWLTDRFTWGSPGPFPVFSIGDLIIGAGLLVTIGEFALALRAPGPERGRRSIS